MTSVINCFLWLSVYECHRVGCVFTYPVAGQVGLGVGSWPSNRTTAGSPPK